MAYGPNPSRRVRQTYADVLNILSHTQPLEQAVLTCQEARKMLAGLGALDLSDLNATAAYADTADSEARHLLSLNRVEEAQALEMQVLEMAEQVLAQRPGDLRSMANRYFAADMLYSLANRRNDDVQAEAYARRSKEAGESYVLFQPTELRVWGYVVTGIEEIADVQLDRGQVAAAIATRRELNTLARDKRLPSSLGGTIANPLVRLALIEREIGQTAASERSLKAAFAGLAEFAAQIAPTDVRRSLYVVAPAAVRTKHPGPRRRLRGRARQCQQADRATGHGQGGRRRSQWRSGPRQPGAHAVAPGGERRADAGALRGGGEAGA
jgi:hypothetical protein